jgi:hypothetical protein
MPKGSRFPLLVAVAVVTSVQASATRAASASPVLCQVTTPNGIAAGPEGTPASSYGNRQVSLGPFGL